MIEVLRVHKVQVQQGLKVLKVTKDHRVTKVHKVQVQQVHKV